MLCTDLCGRGMEVISNIQMGLSHMDYYRGPIEEHLGCLNPSMVKMTHGQITG